MCSRSVRRWDDSAHRSIRPRSRSYVAFAAGSGITPVLSLATDILAREPNSRFTLVYGNRSMARTMFLEDTLALKNRHLGRFAVHFVMSREPQHTDLLNGRIDGAKGSRARAANAGNRLGGRVLRLRSRPHGR